MIAELAAAAVLAGTAGEQLGAFRVHDDERLPAGTVGTLVAATGDPVTVTTPEGEPVTTIPGGHYRIVVRDHDGGAGFHLFGEGFDESTGARFVGTETWTTSMIGGWWRFRELPARPTLVYDTVVTGSAMAARRPDPGLRLVVTESQAGRLAKLVLPGHQQAIRQADLRRFAFVAAFEWIPHVGGTRIGIVQVGRRGETLLVRYERRPQRGFLTAIGIAYHVVRVPRRVLGAPLPQRVVLERIGTLPLPPD